MILKNLKPLGNKILAQPVLAEEKTAGGLYIPESGKDRPTTAMVLAVGPGEWKEGHLVPVSVSVGDTLLHSKYAGQDIGEGLILLNELDVYGILND